MSLFFTAIHTAQPGWRRVVAQSTLWGIPMPAFTTALSFFDGYRSEVVPANLLQAQRDYFGAHTFLVLPGKENERFVSGENIRAYLFTFPAVAWQLTDRLSVALPTDINWTGRGGNVSAGSYVA